MSVEDLHVLAAIGEDVDLDGLGACMAEAEALIAGYTEFRKNIREIDAVLAQDPDNLPAPRPKSLAERRQHWQEQERALRDAARRSMRKT